jgi:hypothetical protein
MLNAVRQEIKGFAYFYYATGGYYYYYAYESASLFGENFYGLSRNDLRNTFMHAGIGMLITTDRGNYDSIKLSRSKEGYGPTMYILAMQDSTARGKGLASDERGQTSGEAMRVWYRFLEDSEDPTSNITAFDRDNCDGRGTIDPYSEQPQYHYYKIKTPTIEVDAEATLNEQVFVHLKKWFDEDEIRGALLDAMNQFFSTGG